MEIKVQIRWKKSSASMGGNACVEVADLGNGLVGVRDSKDPSGPVFEFTPQQWQGFVSGLRGAKTP